ncbi:MAG TPA: hypothetical protein PLV53_10460, partial [Anaerolineaceae bacterium]|nr:hypothetical protein [Anaerolineaceae bacterium]
MTFLDSIWLIPLFPLFGAVVMLLLGRKFDPQGPSEVAVAAGVEGAPSVAHPGHHASSKAKAIVSVLCPGMVLLSFIFSVGAVLELMGTPGRVHQLIQFTWL